MLIAPLPRVSTHEQPVGIPTNRLDHPTEFDPMHAALPTASYTHPEISVVVLTWNREEPVRRCLESLALQSFPSVRTEVVLVDVSDKPVQGLVAEFADRLRLRHLVAQNQGVAANRNHGATQALGRWLAFIDDDCVADPEWLTALARSADGDPYVMVGGRIVIATDAGVWATVGQTVTEAIHGYFNTAAGEVTFLPGCSFLVSRERFLAIGGLDTRFGLQGAEDREFCDRWRETGGKLAYDPAALVRHDHRTTARGFIRQQFNYGRGAWKYRAILQGRTRGTAPATALPRFRLWSLLREPLRRLPAWRRCQVLMAIPIWRLSYLSGFLWQSLTRG